MSDPAGSPIDHANIIDMELHAAREYVLSYITTLKTTQGSLKNARQELTLWENRVTLAQEKGRPDLQNAAQAKADELRSTIETLTSEEKQLEADIARMKVQLRSIEHRADFSVDAELLNAQIEQIVGENPGTEDDIKRLEAERALENLKKQLDPAYRSEQPEQKAPPETHTGTTEQTTAENASSETKPDDASGE